MSRSLASLLHQKLQQVFRERNEVDHTEKLSSNKQKSQQSQLQSIKFMKLSCENEGCGEKEVDQIQ